MRVITGLLLTLQLLAAPWAKSAEEAAPFFPEARYSGSVPSPDDLLGFPLGSRAASVDEIQRCLERWSVLASNRCVLVEYARSHEGRPLRYLLITAPANRARLETIERDIKSIADPRRIGAEAAVDLGKRVPCVAWFGFNIHGNEMEGADAALAFAYRLLADESEQTRRVLEEMVVVLDPIQNPDGRDRAIKTIRETLGTRPTHDSQSLIHDDYWPSGRGNHYLFDLNRDSIFTTQPETQGRLAQLQRWNPQFHVDIHGMGPEDTYLFSPPREPLNAFQPASRQRWGDLLAREQAAAFDQRGWTYYTGEWNEGWYPGYSDEWSVLRGAVGVLYEVAGVMSGAVQHPGKRVQTYRESTHQHAWSCWANLVSFHRLAAERMKEYVAERVAATLRAPEVGPGWYAVVTGGNRRRELRFLQNLFHQGIEVSRATAALTVTGATNLWGERLESLVLPAGTLLVPAAQPSAPLVATLFEVDQRMSSQALKEEREELLRRGSSRIYDITAWNLPLLAGFETYAVPGPLPAGTQVLTNLPAHGGIATETATAAPLAFIVSGNDDDSVRWAARLLGEGMEVRVGVKAFRFDGTDFPPGSMVVHARDNAALRAQWAERVRSVSDSMGAAVVAVKSGLGEGDLPDLGGGFFKRLERPRVALLARGVFSPYDFGAIWFHLDQELQLTHSHLNADGGPPDLGRYNVIVAPSRGGGDIPAAWHSGLLAWVKAGGTLIAVGESAVEFAGKANDLSKVRPLPAAFAKAADHERAVLREWLALRNDIPTNLTSRAVPQEISYPWPAAEPLKEEELKRRDAWQERFMPQGALLAARRDAQHWLTSGAGTPPLLPALVGTTTPLMADEQVESPVRLGVWQPRTPAPTTGTSTNTNATTVRIGWCAVPEGQELRLRIGGLLWPEAAQRLANTALVTRESVGRGQVILFGASPTFRGGTAALARVFSNAIVLGPGLGATVSNAP